MISNICRCLAGVFVSLLAADTAGAAGPVSVLDVQLRIQASEKPYTAIQAQVAYDPTRYMVVDLTQCLSGLPKGHRKSLTTCTNPKAGVIQIAVTNLSDLKAAIPNGVLGTIRLAWKDGYLKAGGVLPTRVRPGEKNAAGGIRLNHVKVYHNGEKLARQESQRGVSLTVNHLSQNSSMN